MSFYSLLRPLLFCLNPEASHHLTLNALRFAHALRLTSLIAPKVLPTPGQTSRATPEEELAQMLRARAFSKLSARLELGYDKQAFDILKEWIGDATPTDVTCRRVAAAPALADERDTFEVRCQVDVGDKGRRDVGVEIDQRPGGAWTARFLIRQ